MKKLSLLLLSIAVAVSATAGVKSMGNAYRPLDKASHKTSIKAPSRVDLITEQPEGTLVAYTRGGEFLTSSFYGYDTDYQMGRVKVVYAPDGKTVYIQDPLCYAEGMGTWVVGELSDDGLYISVPLGQYVSYNEEYDYGLMLAWGTTDVVEFEDEDGVFYWLDFYPDDRMEEALYAIDPATGTITLVGSEGSVENPYPTNCVATGLAGVWSDDGTIATIEWNST